MHHFHFRSAPCLVVRHIIVWYFQFLVLIVIIVFIVVTSNLRFPTIYHSTLKSSNLNLQQLSFIHLEAFQRMKFIPLSSFLNLFSAPWNLIRANFLSNLTAILRSSQSEFYKSQITTYNVIQCSSILPLISSYPSVILHCILLNVQ